MSNIFGFSSSKLEELGATYTATEVYQQPRLWEQSIGYIKENQANFAQFMNKVLATPNLNIVLTGAGTSAYVGDTIYSHIETATKVPTFAIATTDIVSNPDNFIKKETPYLLVSFARSGNSPESVAAYDLFEQKADTVYQLVITCNKEGALAKKASSTDKGLLMLMPKESNDKSFAMTSSFTCMMLSALLMFELNNLENNAKTFEEVIANGKNVLDNNWEEIKAIADYGYDRIVYLGSGALAGLCKEMALKNLELTSGKYITVCESVLGFRHGPKSIINDRTLVIFLTSTDKYTHLYDFDLIREVHTDNGEQKVITLDYMNRENLREISDVYMNNNGSQVADAFAAFNYILFGQIFALFNSINLGISPDNPRPDGTVNRVVQGVIIHEAN